MRALRFTTYFCLKDGDKRMRFSNSSSVLGHSRIQMVMRYSHPVKQHKIDAVRKLQQMQANRKTA